MGTSGPCNCAGLLLLCQFQEGFFLFCLLGYLPWCQQANDMYQNNAQVLQVGRQKIESLGIKVKGAFTQNKPICSLLLTELYRGKTLELASVASGTLGGL